jgi:hypothetical protein
MTYNEEEFVKIQELRDLKATWIAISKNPKSIKRYWQRSKVIRSLPPKEKVSKSKIKGRMSLEIKRFVFNNPSSSIADIISHL